MTTIWQDGFAHYGLGAATSPNMQDGAWAISTGVAGVPDWGARTGGVALRCGTQDDGGNNATRRVLGGSFPAIIQSMGFSVDNLPAGASYYITKPRTGANSSIAGILLRPDGVLVLESPLGNPVGVTQAPVIRARTWHALEMKWDIDGGAFRLDVDGVTVMNITGVTWKDETNTPVTSVEQIAISCGKPAGQQMTPWFSDLIIRSTTGDLNNDFEGDVRVVTLFPDADAPTQGWTRRALRNVGAGVAAQTGLQTGGSPNGDQEVIWTTNTPTTDLGAGDFTIEGFYRFAGLPSGTNQMTMAGKWSELDNQRSWQFYLQGPGTGGNLSLRYSPNGFSGTVFDAIQWPFVPDTNRWYHLAVVRASGELLLFIDGIQQGLPVPDTTVPFAGTEATSFGGQQDVFGPAQFKSVYGWMDELRLTIGVARYIANFTPTTVPFGRNTITDPDFLDVALLLGFDNNSFTDDSSHGSLMRISGSGTNLPVIVLPQDGFFNFQDINSATPIDYTFIEAALTPAFSIYTQTALPSNHETVTVGTKGSGTPTAAVYRFVTTIAGAAAYDVLIGATVQDTLSNLLNAINLGPGVGVTYGAGTLVNDDVTANGLPSGQMEVVANLPGSAGDAIATSTTAADGSWTSTTLAGGADIPGPSEFYFNRPPPDTTVVKAVTIVTRSFKDDNGTCSLQASFVGPLNGHLDGGDYALTLTPSYREDVFELDPDTGDPLTPTSITSGRVRLNRTS